MPVLFVVYPDIVMLDLAGPLQVFAWARHAGDGPLAYETAVVSLDGGEVATDSGVSITSEPVSVWQRRPIHTLVVVGGDGALSAMHDPRMVSAIGELASCAGRVASVCSGALILAAAGLLDGRRATTHWEDCAHLERAFPGVEVDPDPIYVNDGHVWTSAGVTAGTDMALAMVAADLGQEAARERAQALVTYMVRPGGQSQFSPALAQQSLGADPFAELHAWIARNLRNDLRVEVLAARANQSLRSFHRAYVAATGMTPAKGVESIRVNAARELIESTQRPLKVIATRCGFGDEEQLRRAFVRVLGVSPSDYRARFRLD